jgi:hypothetical protein
MQDEMHTGKSVAAELGRFTVKVSGTARLEIELRDHPVHRRHHGPELGHEKHVHDGRRGQREVHRHASRKGKLVYACDALIRKDEKPFPIEGHNLHLERLLLRGDRLIGIEIIGAGPDHAPQKDNS